MMRKKRNADTLETADRIEENVCNLPVMSVALAGLCGAGAMALFSALAPRARRQ